MKQKTIPRGQRISFTPLSSVKRTNIWAKKILRLQSQLNMSTRQVAAAIGVIPEVVSSWINQTYTPNFHHRQIIEEAERKYGIRPEQDEQHGSR